MNSSLTIYHPNQTCTGNALKLSLQPAVDSHKGYFIVTLIKQDQGFAFPHYDMDNAATVAIDALDAAEVLAVLDGKKGTINNNSGLYANNGEHSTDFNVSRRCRHGRDEYHVTINRCDKTNSEVEEFQFTLTDIEAIAIREIVRSSMGVVAFGK